MLRLLVVWQIVTHHLAHVEIVRQLERKHRVVNLLLPYLVDILARTQLIGIFMIVRYASAEHYSLQVERLAQVLAVLVHTAGKTQPPVCRMDEHLYAVEDVAVGIVGAESLVARYLRIRMVVLHQIIIDYYRERAAHYLVVDNSHYLPFREYVYQLLYLGACPEHVAAVGIYSCKRL